MPAALEAVLPLLRCPHCAAGLTGAEASLVCAQGHRYDVARQGYVSLLAARRGRAHAGDSPEMVAARSAFLAEGLYAPIAHAVAAAAREALSSRAAGFVADLGAGTGYHLATVLDGLPGWRGLALDSSPAALRRAARAHPRIGAVACDVWQALPLRDAAVGLAINVFAPRNGREIARVLTPGGALIVVSPTPRHLEQLAPIGGMLSVDADKQDLIRAGLSPSLEPVRSHDLHFDMALGHGPLRTLVLMGPSARHVDSGHLEAWLAPQPETVAVTASVVVQTFRRA